MNSRTGEQGKERAGEGRAEEEGYCSTRCTCAHNKPLLLTDFQTKDELPPLTMTGKDAMNIPA